MGRRTFERTWPKFKRKNLKAKRLHGRDIIVIEDCCSDHEARQCIEAAESMGFSHQGSRGAEFGEALRDNHRVSIEDAALARSVWEDTGLKEALNDIRDGTGNAPLGLNPNIRVYRYSEGQRFCRHIDDSVEVSNPAGRTEFTLLIYMSDVESGGETIFYDDRGRRAVAVAPKKGLALLHRHGESCMEHEGARVHSGVKYVLRSDVVFPM